MRIARVDMTIPGDPPQRAIGYRAVGDDGTVLADSVRKRPCAIDEVVQDSEWVLCLGLLYDAFPKAPDPGEPSDE